MRRRSLVLNETQSWITFQVLGSWEWIQINNGIKQWYRRREGKQYLKREKNDMHCTLYVSYTDNPDNPATRPNNTDNVYSDLKKFCPVVFVQLRLAFDKNPSNHCMNIILFIILVKILLNFHSVNVDNFYLHLAF